MALMTRTFGDDIVDLRDVLDKYREVTSVPYKELDDEDRAFIRMFEQLEEELTSVEDYAYNEPTLIKDTYFTDYAIEFADSVYGINDSMDWPFNRIDWDAAADDLKMDYIEFEIGPYTYYGRNY